MQALIASSRSVSQDIFLERQNKRKYENHLKKIEGIVSHRKFSTLSEIKQQDKKTKTLYRVKSTVKTFRERQEKEQIKRQNRIMLEKIWKMNSNINNDNSNVQLLHKSGTNWLLKKKQAQFIMQQNKRLGNYILNTKTDHKEYKKKLEEEIKQYLDLRKNIRKCTYSSDKNKKQKRAQSEKKIDLNLKQKQEIDNKEVDDGNAKGRIVPNKNAERKNELKEDKAELEGQNIKFKGENVQETLPVREQ